MKIWNVHRGACETNLSVHVFGEHTICFRVIFAAGSWRVLWQSQHLLKRFHCSWFYEVKLCLFTSLDLLLDVSEKFLDTNEFADRSPNTISNGIRKSMDVFFDQDGHSHALQWEEVNGINIWVSKGKLLYSWNPFASSIQLRVTSTYIATVRCMLRTRNREKHILNEFGFLKISQWTSWSRWAELYL